VGLATGSGYGEMRPTRSQETNTIVGYSLVRGKLKHKGIRVGLGAYDTAGDSATARRTKLRIG